MRAHRKQRVKHRTLEFIQVREYARVTWPFPTSHGIHVSNLREPVAIPRDAGNYRRLRGRTLRTLTVECRRPSLIFHPAPHSHECLLLHTGHVSRLLDIHIRLTACDPVSILKLNDPLPEASTPIVRTATFPAQ